MKIATIGLSTLLLGNLIYGDTCIRECSETKKILTFDPKVEINQNITTIMPEKNMQVMEKENSKTIDNITQYILPKFKKDKIVINDDTQIKFCGEMTYLIAVGINHYRSIGFELKETVNDTKNIAKKVLNGCKKSEIHLLLDNDATKKNIFNKIEEIQKKATPKDSILFFYSAYGFNYKNKNYLLTYDSKLSKEIPVLETFIKTKALQSLFKTSFIKKGILILDASTKVLTITK